MIDIEQLLSEMTLAEKAGQLNMLAWGAPLTGAEAAGDATDAVRDGKVGSVINLVGAADVRRVQTVAVTETRRKIPLFFGYDILHGHRTMFPLPIGEACAFDPDLWERTARTAAVEGAADGQDVVFAPMIDVARDPRWGRACEGPGEDPYVAACFAAAKVRGFQGAAGLDDPEAVAACAKHLCGYGAVRAGREYAPSDVAPMAVREVYLPPFAAAVEAGCATIMPALNALNGVPMTAHRELIEDWLRRRLAFDGIVISDYGAIRELIRHGIARDEAEAAAIAIKSGIDIDIMGYCYVDHLATAVHRKLCTQAEVDACVRRVLSFKQRLGLFDDPFRRCHAVEPTQPDRTFARKAAHRAIVLLKNDGPLIPVAAPKRIAVIGPLADAPLEMVGSWAAAAQPSACVSVLAGLRTAFPDATLLHQRGVAIEGHETDGIAAAVEATRAADLVVLCVGEGAALNGEATSRTNLDLPGRQRELAEAVLATDTKSIAIVFCGRPPIVPWLAEQADALICAWMLGTEAGDALADIIAGTVKPTGRLSMTWPRAPGQVPIFYGDAPNGRTFNPLDHYTSKYLDCPNEPLFPFGHGLSTTRFELSGLRADATRLTKKKPLEVAVRVANVGPGDGETTIFLFVRKPSPALVRPSLQLRRFARRALEPWQAGEVCFELTIDDVGFPRDDYGYVVEPGEMEIFVGQSAAPEGLLSVRVTVA